MSETFPVATVCPQIDLLVHVWMRKWSELRLPQ